MFEFVSSMTTRTTSAGSDRVADEASGISVPGHDVDLFAAKLLNHGLHPRAFHSHAGAYRVDVRVPAAHGVLRARPRLPGGGHDAHDALVDLGHLHFEELDQQPHVGAR